MTTMTIDADDRIYTTEDICLDDDTILAGTEGTVLALTGDDAHDLLVEWDTGIMSAVNAGSVALIPV